MNLARKLLMAAGVAPPTGQQLYLSAGSFNFQVPPGVTSICIAAVGASGDGGMSPSGSSGGGGACAWSNNIAVTPGETLTVQVGSRRGSGSGVTGGHSWVRRSSTDLVLAASGRDFSTSAGMGGQATACVGDNRFSGRNGGTSIGGSAAGLGGTLPAAQFQRGGTGVTFGSTSWSQNVNTIPNEVFRYNGQAAGGGGAGGLVGSSAPGASGGVCIIWGPGRGFSTVSNSY